MCLRVHMYSGMQLMVMGITQARVSTEFVIDCQGTHGAACMYIYMFVFIHMNMHMCVHAYDCFVKCTSKLNFKRALQGHAIGIRVHVC